MFNAYEFTFAGHSSREFGLTICDIGERGQSEVSFGNTASIVSSRTVTRIQPVHYGVNYNNTPLEFTLVFASCHEMDRYEMERVALWLTGHQDYQWLSINQPDLEHVEFRCLISTLTPIYNAWAPVAFEATVVCDCPYAYGLPFSFSYSVSSTQSVLFRNNGSVREYLKPKLQIALNAGETQFTIVNHSDNDRKFAFEGLPGSEMVVSVDSNNGIITDETNGLNLYPYCNMKFLRLVHGDNQLEMTGNATVTITGRLLHNVAG